MSNLIYEYIRDDQQKPCGVIVAIKEGDVVKTSFSKVHPDDGPIFDKTVALNKAVGHAKARKDTRRIRPELAEQWNRFHVRASKYFQTDNIESKVSILETAEQ